MLALGQTVMLALWTRSTARAERAIVQGRVARWSSLAWWGPLLPFGPSLLTVVTYCGASRFLCEEELGRRRTHLVLPLWMVAWLIPWFVPTISEMGVVMSGPANHLAMGLVGTGAAVVGALLFRDFARLARRRSEQLPVEPAAPVPVTLVGPAGSL